MKFIIPAVIFTTLLFVFPLGVLFVAGVAIVAFFLKAAFGD